MRMHRPRIPPPALVVSLFLITMPAIAWGAFPYAANDEVALNLIQKIASHCDLADSRQIRQLTQELFGTPLNREMFANELDSYNIRYSARVQEKGSPLAATIDYTLHTQAYRAQNRDLGNAATFYYLFPFPRESLKKLIQSMNKLFKRGNPIPANPPQPTQELCTAKQNSIRVVVRSGGGDTIASLTFYQNDFTLADR